MKEIKFIICCGVGNGEYIGASDLIDSVKIYCGTETKLILNDNQSSDGTYEKLKEIQDIDLIRNKKRLTGFSAMHLSYINCFKYALNNYKFKYLMKVDTDTLIIGLELLEDIDLYFSTHKNAGLLGSYLYDCKGYPRNFIYWRKRFEKEYKIWKSFIIIAKKYGYQLGENVQGGCYILKYDVLREMEEEGLFNLAFIKKSRISEDVIISLFVKYLGFEIHSFVGKNQPLAIKWRGLPWSKEEIKKRNKKVIHSIKFSGNDLNIREFFRQIRQQKKQDI